MPSIVRVTADTIALLGIAASLFVSGSSATEQAVPAHVSPSLQKKMSQADHFSRVSSPKEPRVELSGYLNSSERERNFVTNDLGQSLGFRTQFAFDIFASFESPTFWLTQNLNDWLVVNPHLFAEASIWYSITIKLLPVELTLKFKVMGFKFSPLDF